MKFYYVTNIFDLHTFDNETTTLLKFLEVFAEIHFVSLFFLNERNVTNSLEMIHLKCTVVHYTNLNSSSINKPYLRAVVYAILAFSISIIFILTKFLSKALWNNYYFLIQTSKIYFKMKYIIEYYDVKHLNIRQNLKKGPFYLIYFLKVFVDLQINIDKNFKLMPLCRIKWRLFKVFVKLQNSPLLISNIVKGAVSGLRQFLATECPRKLMKTAFYFILKALFVLNIFKSLPWLFGQVEISVWLERKLIFYDVINLLTNNCNIYIAQYITK